MRLSFSVSAAFLISACATAPSPVTADLAIVDVDIVDVEGGGILPDRDILVRGGHIAEIRRNGDRYTARTTIDGRGNYAIPGLWDMHIHVSSDQISRKVTFPMLIAHGVTGARVMESDCVPRCEWWATSIDEARAQQRDIEAGELLGPHLILGGDTVFGAAPGEASNPARPATEEEGRGLAQLYAARNVDFIKIYSGVSRPALDGIAAEARTLRIPLLGHVPSSVGTLYFSDSGARTIEHVLASNIPQMCALDEQDLLAALDTAYRANASVLDVTEASRAAFDAGKCDVGFRQLSRNGKRGFRR